MKMISDVRMVMDNDMGGTTFERRTVEVIVDMLGGVMFGPESEWEKFPIVTIDAEQENSHE